MRFVPFADEDEFFEGGGGDGSNEPGLVVDVRERVVVRLLCLQLAEDRTIFERDR